LLFLRQILIADKRRIPYHGIKSPLLLRVKQKPSEEIAVVNLDRKIFRAGNAFPCFGGFLAVKFTREHSAKRTAILAGHRLNERTVATAWF